MTTRTLMTLAALGGVGLAAVTPWPLTSCSRANPPCVTHAPPVIVGAPVYSGPVYSSPAYSAPTTYHAPTVYEAEKVYVPFAIPFAYFSFTAQPTTPPPVVVASPPPPQPVAAPAPAPCATACTHTTPPTGAVAPPTALPVAPPAGQASTSAPSPSCSAAVEARLARLEGLLVRFGERQAGGQAGGQAGDDGPPLAREAGTTPVSTITTPAVPAPAPVPTAAEPAALPPQPRRQVQTDLPGALGPAVAALERHNCAACHTGADSRGEVRLWNDAGQWQPTATWDEIYRAVRPRKDRDGRALPPRMPKGMPGGLWPEELALVDVVRSAKEAE